MNQPDPRRIEAELTNLELLGLLSSRIIHDLKNKLAVISGHAQFAEIAKQNPKVAADGMAIIKRVSEEAGRHVETLAKLRRSLPAEGHACEPEATLGILQELLAARPGWKLTSAPPQALGKAAIEARWLKFLAHHFLSRPGSPQGEVEVDQASGEVPIEGSEVAPLFPERQCLRIRFRSASAPEATALPDDPALQFQTLAMVELVRKLEGGLIHQTSPDGHEDITLLIPLNPAKPGNP